MCDNTYIVNVWFYKPNGTSNAPIVHSDIQNDRTLCFQIAQRVNMVAHVRLCNYMYVRMGAL